MLPKPYNRSLEIVIGYNYKYSMFHKLERQIVMFIDNCKKLHDQIQTYINL